MVLDEEEVDENGNIHAARKSYYASRTTMLNPKHLNTQLNQWAKVQDHDSDEFTSNGQSGASSYQINSANSHFVGEFHGEGVETLPNFSINRQDVGGSPRVANHGTNLDSAHLQQPMSQRNKDSNRVDFKDEVDSQEVSLLDSSFNN